VIGNAVKVMRIATGEEIESLSLDDGKNPAAKALGAETLPDGEYSSQKSEFMLGFLFGSSEPAGDAQQRRDGLLRAIFPGLPAKKFGGSKKSFLDLVTL
jgi:hypothetical protein